MLLLLRWGFAAGVFLFIVCRRRRSASDIKFDTTHTTSERATIIIKINEKQNFFLCQQKPIRERYVYKFGKYSGVNKDKKTSKPARVAMVSGFPDARIKQKQIVQIAPDKPAVGR